MPGALRKSEHFFIKLLPFLQYKQMCNTALEREFCGFYRNIFKNCEKCSYEAVFAFFWQVAEMTNKLSIGKFEVKNTITIQ